MARGGLQAHPDPPCGKPGAVPPALDASRLGGLACRVGRRRWVQGVNTNQGKRKMDQVRISELRLHEKHLRASGQMVGACLGECLDAIESVQTELAALRGQAGGVVPGELETLREIVRLLDEIRERSAKRPRGAGGQRMADEIDELLCRLYEMGAHPALRAATPDHAP